MQWTEQNTAESQRLCYFLTLKRSDSRSAGGKRILTWNSHSRSFRVIHFAISYRPKRSSMSPCNTAGLSSGDSEEVATHRQKIAVVVNPTLIWRPRQEEPPRISPQTLYFQKLYSLAYIFVADSMDLSSFKFVQWAPKDASYLRQSAFWPFKVIQGYPRSMILVSYATSY